MIELSRHKPGEVYRVAGLDVTKESLDKLRASLDAITEAERRAWQEADNIRIGGRTLATARIVDHIESDRIQAGEGEQ